MAPSSATSVFISRIRGLPVLDEAGDQAGKVRDVVIQRRAAGRPPRVKGLVVESFAKHRIFVPMAWVTRVDAVQVVITGPVNTRRFERRESEMLVIDDLFDLTVRRLDQSTPAVIFDVAMRPVRSHDWVLSEVALREVVKASRFARRGHTTIAKMKNPNAYGGDDPKQMAANNTSGFNCRKVVGNPYAQSPHSYGTAIDITPVQNPYRDSKGKWWPSNGKAYIDRTPLRFGMLGPGSSVTKQLRADGFFWGGLWNPGRDYQHFEYRR